MVSLVRKLATSCRPAPAFVLRKMGLASMLGLPGGFYWEFKDFALNQPSDSCSSVLAFPSEILSIPKCDFFHGPENAPERLDIQEPSEPASYFEIKGARLLRDPFCVFTPDHYLLCSASQWFSPNPKEHWVFSKIKFPKLTKLPGKAFLLGSGSQGNYYHCLYESMQRLAILKKAGIELASFDHIIVHRPVRRFEGELFSLFGVPMDRIIEWESSPYLQPETLAFTSFAWRSGPWASDFLSTAIDTSDRETNPKRIYISRRSANNRRVLNEGQVIEVLVRYGFESIELERFSVKEQAVMFRDAQAVVGLHGAGLTNLTFAPSGIPVLEFRHVAHSDHHWDVYRRLASLRKQGYSCILSDGNLNGTDTDNIRASLKDVIVPIDALEHWCRLTFAQPTRN